MNIKRLNEKSILKEIRVGKYFVKKDCDEIYILSRVLPNAITLISTLDGNRWREPIAVENYHSPYVYEIEQIFGDDEWYLIGNYDDFVKYIKER
jgi:hypothetical protein